MHLFRWISAFALLAVTMPATLVGQGSQTVSRAEARKAIAIGSHLEPVTASAYTIMNRSPKPRPRG